MVVVTTVTINSATSITVEWPSVAGATSYDVRIYSRFIGGSSSLTTSDTLEATFYNKTSPATLTLNNYTSTYYAASVTANVSVTGAFIHSYTRYDGYNTSYEIAITQTNNQANLTLGASAANANKIQMDTQYVGTTQTNSGYWRYGINNGPAASSSALTPNQYFFQTSIATIPYSTSAQPYLIGKSDVTWDLCEYIIYTRLLTTFERTQIDAYLAAKWGMYHPYYIIGNSTTSVSAISASVDGLGPPA